MRTQHLCSFYRIKFKYLPSSSCPPPPPPAAALLSLQIVAGIIEERGIEVLFKGNHSLCHLLSFLVRTGNTFVGSLLWVDFVRCAAAACATPHYRVAS